MNEDELREKIDVIMKRVYLHERSETDGTTDILALLEPVVEERDELKKERDEAWAKIEDYQMKTQAYLNVFVGKCRSFIEAEDCPATKENVSCVSCAMAYLERTIP